LAQLTQGHLNPAEFQHDLHRKRIQILIVHSHRRGRIAHAFCIPIMFPLRETQNCQPACPAGRQI
jgi:hypothetical protein